MQAITTIGLDIAKSVFQVHGVDAEGKVVICRQLKRRYVLAFFQKLPSCLVGIEACAASHHWSRELQALGHTVRLMPPAYVNDAARRSRRGRSHAASTRTPAMLLARSPKPTPLSNRAATANGSRCCSATSNVS
jgi:transposase